MGTRDVNDSRQLSRALGASSVLVMLALWPRAALAGDGAELAASFDFGGAPRLTAGTETGLDTEWVLGLQMFQLGEQLFRGYGIELSYAGSDSLELFSIMPRVEIGLGAPSFNRPVAGNRAHAWVKYFALTTGYTSGSVWDTAYIDLYQAEDVVEVAVSGIPAYGAIGFRHVGGFELRLEAVAGLVVVTSEEPELPEGDAPAIIPSIGVRLAIGGDTFLYNWMAR